VEKIKNEELATEAQRTQREERRSDRLERCSDRRCWASERFTFSGRKSRCLTPLGMTIMSVCELRQGRGDAGDDRFQQGDEIVLDAGAGGEDFFGGEGIAGDAGGHVSDAGDAEDADVAVTRG
jgi:hypothetical protein